MKRFPLKPRKLQVFFYEASRGQPFPGELELLEDGRLRLTLEEKAARYIAFKDLRISQHLGNIPRCLEFSDGSRIEVADNDTLDCWLVATETKPLVRLQYLLQDLGENPFSILFVLLPLAVLMGWWFFSSVLPAASSYIAFRLDPASYRFLDEIVYKQIEDKLEPSELSPESTARRRELFAEILPAFEPEKYRYRLKFHRFDGPNAFALPGGLIVLSDEIVEMAEGDDELIAVLAHEMAHIQQRHGLRLLLQYSFITTITVALGDLSFLYSLAGLLITLGYSREHEQEADCAAIRYLESKGGDPRAVGRLLRRIDPYSNSLWNYLKTHPSSQLRGDPLDCPAPT